MRMYNYSTAHGIHPWVDMSSFLLDGGNLPAWDKHGRIAEANFFTHHEAVVLQAPSGEPDMESAAAALLLSEHDTIVEQSTGVRSHTEKAPHLLTLQEGAEVTVVGYTKRHVKLVCRSDGTIELIPPE